jgi:hypothetical protein
VKGNGPRSSRGVGKSTRLDSADVLVLILDFVVICGLVAGFQRSDSRKLCCKF